MNSNIYYELYAKYMIAAYYDERIINAKVLNIECPDIQSNELKFGVEVTRAMIDTQCIGYKIMNEYADKDVSIDLINKRVKKSFPSYQGQVKETIDGKKCLELMNVDTSALIEKIETEINKKINKFKNYKDKGLTKIGLYVYSGFSSFELDEIHSLVLEVSKKETYQYNVLFLDCIDKLYIYEDGNLSVRDIEDEVRKSINLKVLDYVE